MAKLKLKKPSKRQPARQRYKIQKKVRDHNKKLRKESKKNPKKGKKQIIQVPNICPFKENILQEVEAFKKLKEAERQRQRDLAKQERANSKEQEKKNAANKSLVDLVADAKVQQKIYESSENSIEGDKKHPNNKQENSLKAYYKEFKKVVEAADVVLEVVDARDPLGTRCPQVEQTVHEMKGNKRLVLVLNKADLVPRNVLDQWLKYLRKTTPTIIFKASTQDQSRKLGQKKLTKASKAMLGATCVGAEMLLSLLGNYCRNKGIKTSIRVGIVGLPNVGKSSLINSLKRSRACNVGSTPGVTRAMQEVQLDSKIKLLDSPGIVFSSGSDASSSLRNSVRISALEDPITPANAILQRVTKKLMMEMYDITEYSSPTEFYSLKAARMGRFKKGGIPDANAAARCLLEDWNNGKIKYYTVPPEDDTNSETHISSSIITEIVKEFDLNDLNSMEVDMLNVIGQDSSSTNESVQVQSLGPAEYAEKMEEDSKDEFIGNTKLLSDNINIETSKKKPKKQKSQEAKKVDPEMELQGNQKLNQLKKKQFKKEKKMRNRREKVALSLSQGLEGFSLSSNKSNSDSDVDM